RALCEIALQPSAKLSRGALQALEKVHPDLHQSVFVLLVDDKAGNHRQAITKLALLGELGKPAVPVVFHQIRKCQEQLSNVQSRWGQPTLVTVITDHMKMLPKIAAEDPQVVKMMIDLTRFATPEPLFVRTKSGDQRFTK